MIGEINLAGIFMAPLIPCMLFALLARLLLSQLLAFAGLYRWVWNRPLFDFSLFLILLGLAFTLIRIETAG